MLLIAVRLAACYRGYMPVGSLRWYLSLFRHRCMATVSLTISGSRRAYQGRKSLEVVPMVPISTFLLVTSANSRAITHLADAHWCLLCGGSVRWAGQWPGGNP